MRANVKQSVRVWAELSWLRWMQFFNKHCKVKVKVRDVPVPN
jgi:hypothetical protein